MDLQTVLAAVSRSNQRYAELTADCTTLACGCAYTNRALPNLPECNFIGDVLLSDEVDDPLALVGEFFTARGLNCHQWRPATIQPVEPLARLIEPHGYRRREHLVLAFPPVALRPLELPDDLRVIAARAMRRAHAALIRAWASERGAAPDELLGRYARLLDEPQYDAFVALRRGEPAGTAAVFQVGPIGRICDLYVPPAWRRTGTGRLLVHYLLQTARRWSLDPVCVELTADNLPARGLLEQAGFEVAGTISTFVHEDVAEVVP